MGPSTPVHKCRPGTGCFNVISGVVSTGSRPQVDWSVPVKTFVVYKEERRGNIVEGGVGVLGSIKYLIRDETRKGRPESVPGVGPRRRVGPDEVEGRERDSNLP